MRKKRLTIDADHKTFLAALEPDSMNYRTFFAFAEAWAKHEALTERMGDPKFEGKNGLVPDKHRKEWDELCQKVDKAGAFMLRAWDTYVRTAKHSIHVPAESMRQLIYDTLMTNADAMPDYLHLRGTERGRVMKGLADNLIEVIRQSQAQVREEESDPSYCDECLSKLG